MSQGQDQPAKIFISYSRRDRDALDRLQIHLKPLIRKGRIELWNDTRLRPGELWMDEIKNALAMAKVAILLVSADFLASDFIATEELPPLLAAGQASGLVIMPVILSPCLYTKTPSLAQFMTVNDPACPLSGMRKPEQEAVWVKLANDIVEALDHPREGHPGPDAGGAPVGSAKPPGRDPRPINETRNGPARDVAPAQDIEPAGGGTRSTIPSDSGLSPGPHGPSLIVHGSGCGFRVGLVLTFLVAIVIISWNNGLFAPKPPRDAPKLSRAGDMPDAPKLSRAGDMPDASKLSLVGVMRSSDGKEAEVAFRRGNAEFGKEAEVAFRRGNAEFDEGRYLEAIDSYSQAIRLNPTIVESYINRGNAYTKSGDHDRAIADYDRAIALNESKGLDRENAIAYFNRGNARFAKGEYDRAIEDYTEAIGRNPKDANAYTNRGIAREKTKDRDGARSDLATAARLEAEAQATPSP